MSNDNPFGVNGGGSMKLGDNDAAYRRATQYLFSLPSELDRPDNYSRAPGRPIHTASLRGDE
jgi:hypothetical protein